MGQAKGRTAAAKQAAEQADEHTRGLGVLDIGSQTTTLALFSVRDGRLVERTEQVRVPLPLVLLLSRDRRLPPETLAKTARIVRKLRRHARRRGFQDLRCVATSAVRDAANGSSLLAELVERAGVRAELLDGRAEAEVAALAVTRTLPIRRGFFFDLGGGSLQVGRLRGGRLERAESLPLGSLRLADAWLANDPPRPQELDALAASAEAHLAALPWLQAAGDGVLVGVGGTIRALAKVDRAARGWPLRHGHGYWMPAEGIERLCERLAKMTDRERLQAGLPAHRVRSAVAGAFAIRALLRVGGFPGLRVCGFGLRDGVAYQVVGAEEEAAVDRPIPDFAEALRLAREGKGPAAARIARLRATPVRGAHQEEVLAAAALLGDEEALAALDPALADAVRRAGRIRRRRSSPR